ncbi:o-succinylbenzoate synthase [Acidiferrimicrobium sp. IK]|uniref:o-succinylbenzoate synthase n=1 Tax=Acidiferrimicrobium sp. IK TaxID=2871700 RepID=UPI003966E66B
MELKGIELVTVRLSLAEPWVTAMGRIAERSVVLVRAVTDDAEGWGECVAQPEPTYTAEYEAGARAVLEAHLAPRVLAGGLAAMEAVKGHQMAKAALEAAVLDAGLRARGVALVDALRAVSSHPGPHRERVPAGVAVGVTGDVDRLLEEVGKRVGEGYRRVKLKVGPGWDVVPVAAVRDAHPGLALQVDANGSYRALGVDGAAGALARLDGYGLLMVEQPLGDDDLVGHAELGRRLATPLCLDEAIASDDDAASAVALGACRVLNVKPGRVGGLREAVRVHDRCARSGIGAWCGGMLETGVGRAANLALAALGGFSLPGDLSASDRYWATDIVDRPATLQADGTIAVPAGPGIGVSVSLPPASVVDRTWMSARGGA